MEGVSPSQATLTSSWQIFDSAQMNAKAPVQRWKDEQGIDHFVDVLPATENGKIQKYKLRDRGITEQTWDREAAGITVKRR